MMSDHHAGLPLNPFALNADEHLHRPEVIRPLTFDHVFPRAYWFEVAPFARTIVPIELAKMGDEQVVVTRRVGERAPPLSIDFLAELPSVNSVIADRLVITRHPLPQIRELLMLNIGATVDQETLLNLPGLVSLSLGSGWVSRELELEEVNSYDWDRYKIDLNVLSNMTGLCDLRFHALAVHSIEPIRFLKGLERLRIEGISAERSASIFSGLTNLRWLALEYWKGLPSLSELVNLERAELMEASFANLIAFQGWKKLRSLALSGRGVKSLEGIGALDSLEELFLGGLGIQDLSPLAAAVNLQRLRLVGLNHVKDFGAINRLENLRSLVIELGSITSTGHLEDIDFITGLEHLEELEIAGALVDDGRLDAIFSLPQIRRVNLMGKFGDQVERLRRQKPGCEIHVIPLLPEEVSEIQVGALKIRRVEKDLWSIIQDLSELLGIENNFAAERAVRQVIRQRDPDLINRLEFDSDADFLALYARSETDIRRVAEIIQSIPDISKGARE